MPPKKKSVQQPPAGDTIKQRINQKSHKLGRTLRSGRGVSLDFFIRNVWVMIFFIVVILVLSGMRYRTRNYKEQINALTDQLREVRSEMMANKAAYMSLIRENDMVELSHKYNLGLEFPLRPAYVLTLTEADSVGAPVANNPESSPR